MPTPRASPGREVPGGVVYVYDARDGRQWTFSLAWIESRLHQAVRYVLMGPQDVEDDDEDDAYDAGNAVRLTALLLPRVDNELLDVVLDVVQWMDYRWTECSQVALEREMHYMMYMYAERSEYEEYVKEYGAEGQVEAEWREYEESLKYYSAEDHQHAAEWREYYARTDAVGGSLPVDAPPVDAPVQLADSADEGSSDDSSMLVPFVEKVQSPGTQTRKTAAKTAAEQKKVKQKKKKRKKLRKKQRQTQQADNSRSLANKIAAAGLSPGLPPPPSAPPPTDLGAAGRAPPPPPHPPGPPGPAGGGQEAHIPLPGAECGPTLLAVPSTGAAPPSPHPPPEPPEPPGRPTGDGKAAFIPPPGAECGATLLAVPSTGAAADGSSAREPTPHLKPPDPPDPPDHAVASPIATPSPPSATTSAPAPPPTPSGWAAVGGSIDVSVIPPVATALGRPIKPSGAQPSPPSSNRSQEARCGLLGCDVPGGRCSWREEPGQDGPLCRADFPALTVSLIVSADKSRPLRSTLAVAG